MTRAFSKISPMVRRICCSGLPLHPMIHLVFDLVSQAIPDSGIRALILDDTGHTRAIRTGIDWNRWAPAQREAILLPSSISGIRNLASDLKIPSRVVLTHDEVFLPHFYHAQGYNEVFRHWGVHRILISLLRDQGKYTGTYILWRGKDMKLFSRKEQSFLNQVSPFIAHGIQTAIAIDRTMETDPDTPFLPISSLETGVVLLDARGNILTMNAPAERLVHQIGLLDTRSRSMAPDAGGIRDAFRNTIRRLARIFSDDGDSALDPPVTSLYRHWSGIFLKFRGYRMPGTLSDTSCYAILVEEGVSREILQWHVRTRFGLSRNEFLVLEHLGSGATHEEITAMMEIRLPTLKSYMARLMIKMEIDHLKDLRKIARTLERETLEKISRTGSILHPPGKP